MVHYNSNDEQVNISKCQYDSSNEPVAIYTYNNLGNVSSKVIFTNTKEKSYSSANYNEKGQKTLTYEYSYKGDKLQQVIIKRYDFYPEGLYVAVEKNIYDDKGIVVVKKEVGGASILNEDYKNGKGSKDIENKLTIDEVCLFDYEYDSTGNWIKMIEYDKSSKLPTLLAERKIEYF